MPVALMALMLQLLFAQSADGVSVTTDMAAYTQGDPIQVTIQNAGPDAITRGGIVCDDVWPLAVEQLQPDGTWQAVMVPRRANCIAIAAILFQPGQSVVRSVSLGFEPGTYRVAYAFDVVGSGPAANSRLVAFSDPFDVNPPVD
jgi:hypothetical protein